MALVISIMVFSALGVLMSRSFALWLDAQANWKLSQHARVARTRLLYGGFGVGTGILSSTNIVVQEDGGWATITFDPIEEGGQCVAYGWQGSSQQNIWILRDGKWVWAQTVSAYNVSEQPTVLVNEFTASVFNRTLTINYTLNFSAMGKNFELPQEIHAHLINE